MIFMVLFIRNHLLAFTLFNQVSRINKKLLMDISGQIAENLL